MEYKEIKYKIMRIKNIVMKYWGKKVLYKVLLCHGKRLSRFSEIFEPCDVISLFFFKCHFP